MFILPQCLPCLEIASIAQITLKLLAHNLWKSVCFVYTMWDIRKNFTEHERHHDTVLGRKGAPWLSYLRIWTLPHSPGVICNCAKSKNWVYFQVGFDHAEKMFRFRWKDNTKSNNYKKEYKLHHQEQKGISDLSDLMSYVPYSTSVSRSKRSNKSAITMEPFASVHSSLKA